MSRASARLDRDLSDLPEGMRWREWMLRAEAAIFASAKPVPRETLAGLVGDACRLDALLADINVAFLLWNQHPEPTSSR